MDQPVEAYSDLNFDSYQHLELEHLEASPLQAVYSLAVVGSLNSEDLALELLFQEVHQMVAASA